MPKKVLLTLVRLILVSQKIGKQRDRQTLSQTVSSVVSGLIPVRKLYHHSLLNKLFGVTVTDHKFSPSKLAYL